MRVKGRRQAQNIRAGMSVYTGGGGDTVQVVSEVEHRDYTIKIHFIDGGHITVYKQEVVEVVEGSGVVK